MCKYVMWVSGDVFVFIGLFFDMILVMIGWGYIVVLVCLFKLVVDVSMGRLWVYI